MSKVKCAGKTWATFHYRECKSAGTLLHDGKMYCKRHHPPTVAAKKKAREDKWQEKWARQERAREAREKDHKEKEFRAECFVDLLAALKTANTAMDDWLNTYAPELCNETRVAETRTRIAEFGTIGYIADVQDKILAAIAKAERKS